MLDYTQAVVMSLSTAVKSSPDKSATDLFVLHEGTLVEITDRLDNWCEITIADVDMVVEGENPPVAQLGAGGAPLAQLLEGCGVALRYLGRTETPQGHAIIQVQPDGQNCIFLYGGANQAVTPEDIDAVLSHFAPGDYLLMQNEMSNLTYMLRAAVQRGLRVVLNVSPISEEILHVDQSVFVWLVVT